MTIDHPFAASPRQQQHFSLINHLPGLYDVHQCHITSLIISEHLDRGIKTTTFLSFGNIFVVWYKTYVFAFMHVSILLRDIIWADGYWSGKCFFINISGKIHTIVIHPMKMQWYPRLMHTFRSIIGWLKNYPCPNDQKIMTEIFRHV